MRKVFLLSESNRDKLAIAITRAKPGLLITFETPSPKRSLEANAFYWGVVLKAISEQLVYGEPPRMYKPKVWHEFFCGEFLGFKDMLLPSGRTVQTVLGTSKLSEKRFADYLTKVQAWGAAEGVVFPEEDEMA